MRLEALLVAALAVFPAGAQYAGPAILSRGEAPAAMSAPEIRFRPFAEITGVYDTGLAGVQVTDTGNLANQASTGIEVGWGISGTHSWRHTKVGLDYRGDTAHYFRRTYYDSIDQSLLLSVVHQISRRMVLNLHEAAGLFSRNPGLTNLPQTVSFDPSSAYIPTTDFFDNRTIYLTSSVDLTYQKTARLSFDVGGFGFINRRRSTALYGTVGEGAQADVQYRVSKMSTIGANYGYQHYGFTRVFGGTDVHMVNLTYARQLTRWVELSAFGGAARIESTFLRTVPLDPVIAAILGISSTNVVRHTVLYEPNGSLRLSRTFQRGVAYISAAHTVTPGNGLFLTSVGTALSAGYNYTGLRRWSLGADVSYMRFDSIGNVSGIYGGVSGTLTVSRQIIRSVHMLASYSARQYNSPDFQKYNRVIHSVRVGFGFAPGDIPIRIW